MKYDSGEIACVGDMVEVWSGNKGVVVCDFDGLQFIRGYSMSDWSEKMIGIMVLSDSGDLFHFEIADEDMILLKRG